MVIKWQGKRKKKSRSCCGFGGAKKNAVVPLKQISMHNHNALKDEIKT